MTGDAEWTGRWVAEKIVDRIQDVEVIGSQILSVAREHDSFLLGTTAVERVDCTVVRAITETVAELSFVVNIPKESYWTGEAICLLSRHSVAFGGMGDLYRALSRDEDDLRQYRRPEFDFVECALGQHDRVTVMTRVHDRKYVLGRRGLTDFTIVLLNEYELTKDHVRRAKTRYGLFDAILMTNPNGKATAQATEVAKSIGANIYEAGQLMARINGP